MGYIKQMMLAELPGNDEIFVRKPDFDGAEYDSSLDKVRLSGQLEKIYELMRDGRWRTVATVAHVTGYPENSIQAQLRNLRKDRFGGYLVEKRRVTPNGLYEYRVLSGS